MPDIVHGDIDTPTLNRVAQRIFGRPLMIAPGKLAAILDAIGPRLGLTGGAAQLGLPVPDAVYLEAVPDRRADIPGEIESRTPYALTADGVAVVSVAGSLVHRSAAAASPWSGLRSYGDIEAEIRAALNDGQVRAVLLDVDSGGGEVSGAFELADVIFKARGSKPIWAVADTMALSAAYLVGSAADRLVLPMTGMVGSIGVIAQFRDVSARDKLEGVKWTSVYFGARKDDFNPHKPLGREAEANLQESVDRWGEKFVAYVARHRKGMSADDARATEAGIFEGVDGLAVAAGLADEVMTFREALAALGETARRPAMSGLRMGAAPAASGHGQDTEVQMSEQERPGGLVAVEQPGAAASPTRPAAQPGGGNVVDLDAARREGAAEAASRAADINALCKLAGKPALAGDFIASTMTVAQVRDKLLTEKAAAGGEEISGHRASDSLGGQAEIDLAWPAAMKRAGVRLKGEARS